MSDVICPACDGSGHVYNYRGDQFPCEACELAARVALLEGLLREARNQIEYLHEKWVVTGSGNAVIARIDAALGSSK